MLYALFAAGRIRCLKRQVRFPLTVTNRASGERIKVATYVADFTYEIDGELIVEDAKGWRTEMYRLKKKWLRAEYGIEIKES